MAQDNDQTGPARTLSWIERNLQSIMVALVIGAIGWSANTLLSLGNQMSVLTEKTIRVENNISEIQRDTRTTYGDTTKLSEQLEEIGRRVTSLEQGRDH